MRSVVDNGRTHAQIMDLPPAKDGTDQGPTALEVCVMSLAGCISTIFAVFAKKMRLEFTALKVTIDAEKPDDADTITKVTINMDIQTEAKEDKIERCFDMTCQNCPVGVLYRQAGVEIVKNINING